MALSLALAKLSPEAAKGFLEVGPVKREAYLRQTLESIGDKLLGYYVAEGGEFDIVALVESDNPDNVVTTGLRGNAVGLWTNVRNYRLYTTQEVEDLLATGIGLSVPGKE